MTAARNDQVPASSPQLSRRRLIAAGAVGAVGAFGAVGAVGATAVVLAPVVAHAATPRADATSPTTATADLGQIPATENLMYEHGVLKRVLLVYNEAVRRITAREELPATAVQEAATIIHDYIESFHEALEEGYVFPRLKRAGRLVSTVDTLLTQHARGRHLTQTLLTTATASSLANPTTSAVIAKQLALFVRMYEPHEAREDTVVFPTYRSLLSDRELEEMAQLFSSDQTGEFGKAGFADAVAHVAEIETTLGLADLDQFTPPLTS